MDSVRLVAVTSIVSILSFLTSAAVCSAAMTGTLPAMANNTAQVILRL